MYVSPRSDIDRSGRPSSADKALKLAREELELVGGGCCHMQAKAQIGACVALHPHAVNGCNSALWEYLCTISNLLSVSIRDRRHILCCTLLSSSEECKPGKAPVTDATSCAARSSPSGSHCESVLSVFSPSCFLHQTASGKL